MEVLMAINKNPSLLLEVIYAILSLFAIGICYFIAVIICEWNHIPTD